MACDVTHTRVVAVCGATVAPQVGSIDLEDSISSNETGLLLVSERKRWQMLIMYLRYSYN